MLSRAAFLIKSLWSKVGGLTKALRDFLSFMLLAELGLKSPSCSLSRDKVDLLIFSLVIDEYDAILSSISTLGYETGFASSIGLIVVTAALRFLCKGTESIFKPTWLSSGLSAMAKSSVLLLMWRL